jgi:mono/diheme cytochrome c family protein
MTPLVCHVERFTFALLIALTFSTMWVGTSPAQQSSQRQQSREKDDQALIQPGPPMSGQDIFKWYCAACHGKNAKGNGPAASELKVPPPDLTTLAKRNKGKFPADYVTRILMNGAKAPAHGTADMPTWGPLFAELNAKGRVTVEIDDVVRYLESLQQK